MKSRATCGPFGSALLLFAALAATQAGCITHTVFEPNSAISSPQVTEKAVRFYDRDAEILQAAGGDVIGTVGSRGNSFTNYETLADRAEDEAAEHGGTHVILTDRGVEHIFVTTAGSARTNCSTMGNQVNCNSTYRPPTTRAYAKPTAQFVVVRVPPERWAELPPALRPSRQGR